MGRPSALGALRVLIESGAKHGADLDVEYADGADEGADDEGADVAMGHMDATHGRRCRQAT